MKSTTMKLISFEGEIHSLAANSIQETGQIYTRKRGNGALDEMSYKLHRPPTLQKDSFEYKN